MIFWTCEKIGGHVNLTWSHVRRTCRYFSLFLSLTSNTTSIHMLLWHSYKVYMMLNNRSWFSRLTNKLSTRSQASPAKCIEAKNKNLRATFSNRNIGFYVINRASYSAFLTGLKNIRSTFAPSVRTGNICNWTGIWYISQKAVDQLFSSFFARWNKYYFFVSTFNSTYNCHT